MKRSWPAYPSCWTYGLLTRLRDFAVTVPRGEVPAELKEVSDLLEAHENDVVDAEIVAVRAEWGGRDG
jgi:hypothetical protein